MNQTVKWSSPRIYKYFLLIWTGRRDTKKNKKGEFGIRIKKAKHPMFIFFLFREESG